MATALLFIGGLVFLGHLLIALFHRTRIPDVLLLVLMGIFIGPNVLDWIRPGDFGKVGPVLTTIALLVILFEGGVALHLKSLASAILPAILLASLTSVATFLLVFGLAVPFFESPFSAILLGVILCATSSAVVIPMLAFLHLSHRARAILTLESLFADVVCIALTFSLVLAYGNGHFDALGLAADISWTLAMGIILGLVAAILWMMILERVHRFPNTLFTEFAVVFMLYGIAEHLKANGAIAALVFGVTGANLSPRILQRVHLLRNVQLYQFNAFQRDVFAEGVFLLKLIFFVYMGISLPFNDPYLLILAICLTLALYAARFPIVLVALPRTLSRRDAALASAMVPKGLTAAVIASIPLQHDYPEGRLIQDIAFAVVLVSITLTSLLVPFWELILRHLPPRRFLARYAGDAGPSARRAVSAHETSSIPVPAIPNEEP